MPSTNEYQRDRTETEIEMRPNLESHRIETASETRTQIELEPENAPRLRLNRDCTEIEIEMELKLRPNLESHRIETASAMRTWIEIELENATRLRSNRYCTEIEVEIAMKLRPNQRFELRLRSNMRLHPDGDQIET